MTAANICLAKSYKIRYSYDVDLSKKHKINKWVRVLLFRMQEYKCLKLHAFQCVYQSDYRLRSTSLDFGDQKTILAVQVNDARK